MKISVKPFATACVLASTVGLISCGGSTTTDSDFESVDVSAPVSDWQLVWSDEFDGNEINSNNWTHEVNCAGGGNNEKQCYTDADANSFVADGNLNIVALPSQDGEPLPYTSARLVSQNKADFTYGRFEIRAKLPFGQGAWPALWMMPTDSVYGGWPRSGEIDIMEAVNLKTQTLEGTEENRIYGTLHYGKGFPDNSSSGKGYAFPEGVNPADDFHTYAIEWQEGEIRWYVDGYLYATQMRSEFRFDSQGRAAGLKHRGWFAEYFDSVSGDLEVKWENAPFDQDFFFIMNVAVGGNWPESVNEGGIDATAFAEGQTMQVDYIRVYECAADPLTGRGCETVRQGYKDPDDALVEGAAPIPSIPSLDDSASVVIFEDEPNPNWALWDCCGGSTPTVEMDDAPFGNVVEFTVGAEPTVLGFTSREEFLTDDNGVPSPFDASGIVATQALTFDMKLVTAPANPDSEFLMKIESAGAATAVELPLSASSEGAVPLVGEWQSYTFPLQALADAGLDVSAIDVVMIFPAWSTGEGAVYRVDNVKIGDGNGAASPELNVFIDAENPNWPLWDCCGGSMPTVEIDDDEHGSVAEFVIGAAPTVMGFISRAEFINAEGGVASPFDATAILSNGVIQFDIKLVNAPDSADSIFLFKVESDNGATAVELPMTESIEGLSPSVGAWQTVTFTLADLANAGLDVSAIDVLMMFPAWDTGNGAIYRIDNVRIYDPNASSGFSGFVLFADEAREQWSIWDCCGGTTPSIEADDTEHGAVAEFTIGATPTVMGLLADDDVYLDASTLLTNGVVQFEMKVVNAPNDPDSTWLFKIESGDTSTAVELPLADSQEGQEPVTGEWQTYTYSLQALFDAGLDVTQIDVVMVFPAWGTGDGAVYRIDNMMIFDPTSVPQPQGLTLFKDASNPEWPIWDCCGGSTPVEIEDDATHGVTAEFSIGSEPTVMGFMADEGVYFDASNLLQNGMVTFEMKVISAPLDPNSTWLFKIESGDTSSAVELALSDSLEGAEPVVGEWQTYSYSLQTLFDAGLDISQIDVVMIFPAWATGNGAVYRVDNAYITAP
ncbi:glycoside hydrolase family 16 protein [Alteromonas oceanisediminis]|nr:glycoside hydrolase family 16 protein [Alteromonas oceanisediminis]